MDTQGVVNVIKEANEAKIPVFTPGKSPAGGKVETAVVFNEVYTGEAMANYLVKDAKIKPDPKSSCFLAFKALKQLGTDKDEFEGLLNRSVRVAK